MLQNHKLSDELVEQSLLTHSNNNVKPLFSDSLNIDMPTATEFSGYHNLTFAEKFKQIGDKLKSEKKTYRRREASKLIGFPGNSPAFTKWLRDHYFLDCANHPHRNLINQDLMVVKSTQIFGRVRYDPYDQWLYDSEYEVRNVIKCVYTPLFTEKGIEYFKRLLVDPALLKEESDNCKP